MYHVSRGGWSEVEKVVIVLCMVVGDERCELVIVVYVEDGGWVE